MGDVDPEDTNSLDSNDEVVLVHLEREEAEMLEEARRTEEEEEDDDELQTSALSILGGERELAELSEEEQDLHAPETGALLVSAEEPRVQKRPAEFRHVVPPMALPLLPVVKLDPPSTTSTPVPSTITSEAEELYSTQGLQPPSILDQVAAEPPTSERRLEFSQVALSDVEEHSVQSSEAAAPQPTAPKTPKTPEPLSSTGLLCGGAALVAVLGVVAYGAVAYCRK
ncbi:MICAL-like protein 1 [Cyclopterus lumpus]|uniref:MICAL-like protein 1 n=1 Tax=Cyclopterus lumpus TaxID=8103 RepID=UPI0014870B74|nr:MICAL-like protein 1 [Cyclopterus lumpus]XP_034382331.1 MICAL-like protein 1 [Cyclopterus lumpus]